MEIKGSKNGNKRARMRGGNGNKRGQNGEAKIEIRGGGGEWKKME